MEIRHKLVSELTSIEYGACYRANYGHNGYMREELRRCRRGAPGLAILLWDGPDDSMTSLIGWCLLTPVKTYGIVAATKYVKSRSIYTAEFWVKAKYRRQGYAKTLMAEVKKLDPNPHVFPHDNASGEFFSSYQCQVLREDKAMMKPGKPRVA